MPKKNIDFKEYLMKKNEKEQNEILSFIEKYRGLMMNGNTKQFGPTEKVKDIKEALNSRDASIIMPKIMEGVLEEAAEPLYLGTKLFKTINMDRGNRMIFPAIGALRAYEMAEGQEYRDDHLDLRLKEKATEVDITKKGVMVPITEEMVDDSQWDVVGMHVEAAGRAMARLKEELIFKAMTKHGWTVFDNNKREKHPEAGTTGRDEYGNYNDTLAIEDFFDIVVALMHNEYTPTDALIHPLTWSVFVKNGLIDMFDQPVMGNDAQFSIDMDAANGRIPMGLNLLVSPFIPFDKVNKKFDMYVVDRNNIGVIVQKDEMSTDQFTDPYRDILNLKFRERYGIGILDEGKAVATAKNISLDVTYEKPDLVRMINADDYGKDN